MSRQGLQLIFHHQVGVDQVRFPVRHKYDRLQYNRIKVSVAQRCQVEAVYVWRVRHQTGIHCKACNMKTSVSQSIFLGSFVSLVVMICSMTFAVGSAIITELFNDADVMEASQADGVDSNALPTPAASLLSCEGIVYRESVNGVRYVREAGGGIYIVADTNDRVTVYRLEQGYATDIEGITLDEETTRKLEYALHNCRGPFIPSGMILHVKTTWLPPPGLLIDAPMSCLLMGYKVS